jgi:hypothetical protein
VEHYRKLPDTPKGINILGSLLALELATDGCQGNVREVGRQLLSSATRHDATVLSSLLADEFREFGSSGKAFSKAEIISHLQSESSVPLSLHDFEAYPISDQAFLVTFRAVKAVPGLPSIASLRSSLWIYRDGRWQMLFHQGTKIPQ